MRQKSISIKLLNMDERQERETLTRISVFVGAGINSGSGRHGEAAYNYQVVTK